MLKTVVGKFATLLLAVLVAFGSAPTVVFAHDVDCYECCDYDEGQLLEKLLGEEDFYQETDLGTIVDEYVQDILDPKSAYGQSGYFSGDGAGFCQGAR